MAVHYPKCCFVLTGIALIYHTKIFEASKPSKNGVSNLATGNKDRKNIAMKFVTLDQRHRSEDVAILEQHYDAYR